MKQSNITYKETYHFNQLGHRTEEDSPSIYHQPPINTHIAENPYRQNVEIERDEVVLRPDLSALHKAGGRKHTRGGTPVYLQPESFVFSDDPSLAISPGDKERFELKESGASPARRNTPARVLQHNVDLKHYNRLMTLVADPTADKVAKDSAGLMLQKYLQTIGGIAYLQEEKKDFPQGLPAVAHGTAPVFDSLLDEELAEQKQYAKYGGLIKAQKGRYLTVRDKNHQLFGKKVYYDPSVPGSVRFGDETHMGEVFPVDNQLIQRWIAEDSNGLDRQGMYQRSSRFNPYFEYPGDNGFDAKGAAAKAIDPFTYTPPRAVPRTTPPAATTAPTGSPAAIPPAAAAAAAPRPATGGSREDRFMGKRPPYPAAWTNYYDKTLKQQFTAPSWISPEQFYQTPGIIDYMKGLNDRAGIDNDLHKPDDGWWGWRHQAAFDKFYGDKTPGLTPPIDHFDKVPVGDTPAMKLPDPKTGIHPGDVDGEAQNGVPVKWSFTPWQKQSQLYNLSKWAMVDREMPYRSHYNATFADPTLVNPEQAVGDLRALSNQQMQGADLYSPIMANAQKAAAYGQFLDRVPGVRSQYDNQNAQIQNQFAQYNNQVRNDETLKNLQFDQQYYRDAATGRVNFRNARGFAADQYMNNRMQDVQDNQALAYKLLQLGPKPAYGFNFETGDLYRNDKNLLDVQTDSRQDILQDYLKGVDFNKLSNKEKIDYINVLTKRDALRYIRPTPGVQKKGGTTRRNPYRK